jgi:hypothetical protein
VRCAGVLSFTIKLIVINALLDGIIGFGADWNWLVASLLVNLFLFAFASRWRTFEDLHPREGEASASPWLRQSTRLSDRPFTMKFDYWMRSFLQVQGILIGTVAAFVFIITIIGPE